MENYSYASQRAALERFAAALRSRPSALKDDDCGDPIIAGAAGRVIACPGMPGQKPLKPGFQLYVIGATERKWTGVKRALGFAELTNDGEGEGAFYLDRLPTRAETIVIRSQLGIKAQLSEQELARRRSMTAAFNARWQAARNTLDLSEIEAITARKLPSDAAPARVAKCHVDGNFSLEVIDNA
jgi:hypothetical protein